MESLMRNDGVREGTWQHYAMRVHYIQTYNELKRGRYKGETEDKQTRGIENLGVPRNILDVARENLSARKHYKEAGEECPVLSMASDNIPQEHPKRQKKKKKQ